MNGMEKIQAKIAEDARAELAALESDTKSQIDAIMSKAKAEAEAQAEDILTRGKAQAEERKVRLASSAQMECRKMELAVKQDVISESFDVALKNLCALPEAEYVNVLVAFALSSIKNGKETLIFSAKDKDTVGKQVVARVNEAIAQGKAPDVSGNGSSFLDKALKALKGSGAQGGVTLSSETRNMPAGFIMLDETVEINCDFDTLVRLQRNELELEVVSILF